MAAAGGEPTGVGIINPSTTNTSRISSSAAITAVSALPTSLVPTRFTATTTAINPIPMAFPDQSGVAHGSRSRT